MKHVHTVAIEHQYPVELHQREDGSFRVTYGSEQEDNMDYIRAAEQFGYCVFHALTCAGQIDNETDTDESEDE